jgi:hypothetical protein
MVIIEAWFPEICHHQIIFIYLLDRSAHDGVATLMASDMMETLLERRSSKDGGTNRTETGGSSDIRTSSLDDAGFIHVDPIGQWR